MNKFLDGNHVPFKTLKDRKKLIGKKIKYLRSSDIDRSGRGYFFPRIAQVTHVEGRNIEIDTGDWLYASDLVEVVTLS